MSGMTEKQAESLDLVYGLEDKPPFGNALLSAVTHLLAIFVPMITPALIVGGALELPVEMTAYLVSMAMVASGVGTYLQVNRFGPVGSGMLSIQSVNFSFVTVMIALGTGMKEGGLTEDVMISTLLGVSFVGAFLVCFSAWLLPYLEKSDYADCKRRGRYADRLELGTCRHYRFRRRLRCESRRYVRLDGKLWVWHRWCC